METVIIVINSERPLEHALDQCEREYITAMLRYNDGSREKTASMLGISMAKLYRRIEHLNKPGNPI